MPPSVDRALLKTDAEIALTSTFVDQAGMTLIAGTGSICFGRDTNGDLHRTGGWGSEFDDAGSGAWIGHQAIRLALQQADGRLPKSSFQEAVFQHFQIQSLDHLQGLIQDNKLTNTTLASVCPAVLDAAQNGDSLAQSLCQAATEEHKKLLLATQEKCQSRFYSLAGGLFSENSPFKHWLVQALQLKVPELQLIHAQLPAVAGAVIEAYLHAHTRLPSDFLEALRSQA